MRIIQMLPTLSFGDAVGNHTLALYKLLKENGIDTAIYAKNIDKRVKQSGVHKLEKYKDSPDTIILYHLSIGDELNTRIKSFRARIIINYHNITPGVFFEPYNAAAKKICDNGERDVQALYKTPLSCICDSKFNMQELQKYGYRCPMVDIPILIPFEDYKKTPGKKVIKKYSDGWTNIVFTGRVAPNKKQEDLMEAFYYYNTYINPKSRLILVGSYSPTDNYFRKLRAYKEQLEMENVIFTGQIPFADILAYYKIADVFLCLSEHEGFCVPLVEAMEFGVPVVAYNSTAIGDTLGGSALLLDNKDPRVVAEAINKLVTDEALRQTIIENEKKRLEDFDNKVVGDMFLDTLREFSEIWK